MAPRDEGVTYTGAVNWVTPARGVSSALWLILWRVTGSFV